MSDKIFGLYKTTQCTHYDGFGTDSHTCLLATSTDPNKLRDRWNKVKAKECYELAHRDKSYHRQLEPGFRSNDENMLEFSGSTGGGYAGVNNIVEIKPVPQWDENHD